MKTFSELDKKFEIRGMKEEPGITFRMYRSKKHAFNVSNITVGNLAQTRASVKRLDGKRMDFGEILNVKDEIFERGDVVALLPSDMCQIFNYDTTIVQFMELPKDMLNIIDMATRGLTSYFVWDVISSVKYSKPDTIDGWEYFVVKPEEWWLEQKWLDKLMKDVWGNKRGFQILSTAENDRRRDHRQIIWRKPGLLLPNATLME